MPYKYFTEDELKCQHCGAEGMDEDFMEKIEDLRHDLGFPFKVTSAYRCKDHPIEARKASPGAHESGHALDISIAGEDALRLLHAALEEGMTGIGVNQKGDSRFIHLDDLGWAKNRPRPWIWSY
jgi:zinc D-Ala-D-Ala carboxypeptidase